MKKIKWAIERVKNGIDERASYDIEYAMLEYLRKALDIYLEKAPRVVEDEVVYYHGAKYGKYKLAKKFRTKLEEYLKEYWYYEDEKHHERKKKELMGMWEALRDFLSW